jgi:hypothetical protein
MSISVYRSIDGGRTWHPIKQRNYRPQDGPLGTGHRRAESSELLCVGGEGGGGVYRSGHGSEKWVAVNLD